MDVIVMANCYDLILLCIVDVLMYIVCRGLRSLGLIMCLAAW